MHLGIMPLAMCWVPPKVTSSEWGPEQERRCSRSSLQSLQQLHWRSRLADPMAWVSKAGKTLWNS